MSEVKELPILMNAPMVRATLREVDPKTQTRRLVKHPLGYDFTGSIRADLGYPASKGFAWAEFSAPGMSPQYVKCPFGKIGDRLWVRENFQPLFHPDVKDHWETDYATGKGYAISYPATEGVVEYLDSAKDRLSGCIKPSIHMPRWASRITLEMTGVRVERLQDITEEEAISEGCPGQGYYRVPGGPRKWFQVLWDNIYGSAGNWNSNPYVWVVSFRRVGQ